MNKQKIIRPLGYNELYQLARYTTDQYRGTSVLCRYEIPANLTNKDELTNTINTAIKHVIAKSPTLRSVISGANTSAPFWTQLPSLDLTEHIKWITLSDDPVASEKAVQATLQEQLSMRFWALDERPGWRLIVMQHTTKQALDILFVWNHPHTDGIGGKIFHSHLLSALHSLPPSSSQPPHNLVINSTDSSAPFPPPIEETVKLTLSKSYILKAAWKEYKPPSLFPSPTHAHWAPIQPEPYAFSFLSASIPSTTLKTVLRACRAKNTTLTPLLNSLILTSLATHLSSEKASAFKSSTAIDQRRFVPAPSPTFPDLVPAQTVANYVTTMYHTYTPSLVTDIRAEMKRDQKGRLLLLSEELLETVWVTARRVRAEIQERLGKGVRDDVLGLAKLVPDWEGKARRDVQRGRELAWFLTNLGTFGKGEEGGETGTRWVRRRAQFTLSTEVPLAALLVGVASVEGGEMMLTCTWQEGVVERGVVEGLMGDLVGWLGQIGGEECDRD